MAVDIRINYVEHDLLGRPFGSNGILASMDKYRIDNAILISGHAVACNFREGNAQLLEAIKDNNRLYGYIVVNPNYPEESIEEIRNLGGNRKMVALALFSGAFRPYPTFDDCEEILNAYRRYVKPVLLYVPHAEAVEAAKEIAAKFPTIQFVFGSMGGADWKAALNIGKLLNVHMETSGSFDVEKIEEAVARIGAHRILFGSDLPISDPASEIALIRASNISKDAMIKIFNQNAVRLFRLQTPAQEEESSG